MEDISAMQLLAAAAGEIALGQQGLQSAPHTTTTEQISLPEDTAQHEYLPDAPPPPPPPPSEAVPAPLHVSAPLLAPASAPPRPASRFKYKYAEAGMDGGCPAGITELEWNKIYTAADSRIYNKHGKNANASRTRRQTGETRVLALAMLQERVNAEAGVVASPVESGGVQPRPYMPKGQSTTRASLQHFTTYEPAPRPEDFYVNGNSLLSLAEQIKMGGRDRRATAAVVEAKTMSSEYVPPPVATPPKKPRRKPDTKPRSRAKAVPKVVAEDSTLASPTFDNDSESGSDDGVYCICRKGDDHRLMLACEGVCEDWYHCSCMRINEDDVAEDRNDLLDRFVCPACTVRGGENPKITTWKPMCRYYNIGGCRRAARVTLDPPSKYCSEEHKVKFWEHVRDRIARQDTTPSMGGRLNTNEIANIIEHGKTYDGIQAMGKKPRLPVPEDHDPTIPLGIAHLTPTESSLIQTLHTQRKSIESRILISQQQQTLAKLVLGRLKTLISSGPEHKDLCGYDDRLSFNEAQFSQWMDTDEGATTIRTGVLGARTAESAHINRDVPCPDECGAHAAIEDKEKKPTTPSPLTEGMCTSKKKKCLRHREWFDIHHGDFWYQETLLRREARRLEAREREIVDGAEARVAMRAYEAVNWVEKLF